MSQTQGFEVAVIGGGIAGLTLAIALHHRGVPVTIYEQAPAFGEIGAGVSFSPNAVHAMGVCHPGITDAFKRVCTKNLWPSKQNVWFDFLVGHADSTDQAAFTIFSEFGQNGVHRARFLDNLVKLLPMELARFGKRLLTITTLADGRQEMAFEDGTRAQADAIIGCDGIKSQVRQTMFGPESPISKPSYTYKYAYRGLVAMQDAVGALDEERAQNACVHMGQDAHVLTFPVDGGNTLNVVAFKTATQDWPDSQRLTRKATKKELLHDFRDFGEPLRRLLSLTGEDLDVWAIFDLGVNPVPAYSKNRVCIIGDASHATSPHHGAGAGLCIEDSAILAELLADRRVRSGEHLAAAFATFDAVRRPRGNWLVQSSRRVGDCYEWRAEGIGRDFEKIEAEINDRNGTVANVDCRALCEEARRQLGEQLSMSNL